MRSRVQTNDHWENNNQMLDRIHQRLSTIAFNSERMQSSELCIVSAQSGVAAELGSFQHEIQRVAADLSNPIFRRGFETSMSMALKEISRYLQDIERSRKCSRCENQIVSSTGSSSAAQTENSIVRKRYFSTSTTETTNFFGSIVWSIRSYLLRTNATSSEDVSSPDDEEGSEMWFKMTPALWLVRLGLRYQMRFSVSHVYGEWTKAFRTFCVLPNDSLVFRLCEKGNLDALREMFQHGEASPYIMNEKGETLLHVSIDAT